MSNFMMLLTCLAAGLVLRRSGHLPDGTHEVLNTVIVFISLQP
jgi:hypothetical protein